MKVIVTGGRNYNDKEFLYKTLDDLKVDYIIQGGASGADALARQYSIDRRLPCHTYHADWDTYGRPAGPIRNKEMLTNNLKATLVVFPGGAGTKNCKNVAIKLGMKVIDLSS